MITITGTEEEVQKILSDVCLEICVKGDCDENCIQCKDGYIQGYGVEFEITKPTRWKPNKDETYWTIQYGYLQEKYIPYEEYKKESVRTPLLYEHGYIYKTKKEAEEACRVLNIVEENKMTRDEIDDWIYNNQQSNITDVYKLELNAETGIILVVVGDIFVDANVDYFKDEETARKVLAECGKEALKKYYFKVVE